MSGAAYGGVPFDEFLVVCASTLESFSAGGVRAYALGVGKTAVAMSLPGVLRHVAVARAVLLFGIAGAYPERHRVGAPPVGLGGVCVVGSDRFGDEGVETPQGFLPIEEVLGHRVSTAGGGTFGGVSSFPANPRMAQQAAALLGVPIVRGVTVSTCSGTDASSERMHRRSGADVETMEGAAVAYVCRQLELPLLHVRAISNWTGDRDRGEWNVGAAVDAAKQAVLRLAAGR